MANAKRDENRVTTLMGISSIDGLTPTNMKVDPSTNRLYVDALFDSDSVTQVMDRYGLNHIEQPSATITYLGKETKDADWLIMKLDTTSGLTKTYATVTNNPTVTIYADAWTAKATTLTYGTYSQAF